MDASKYSSLVHYLRDKEYPEGVSKAEKGVLRRLSKQFTFDVQSGSLFYVDRGNDGQPLSVWSFKSRKRQEFSRSVTLRLLRATPGGTTPYKR